jgi:Cof subfamily protein (haloacid dehalogenase superfamily)
MTKYKLLATDLDDSLLDDRYGIPRANREAIGRALEMGIKVVLATGRMYRSALPYALELGLDSPLITYQGAYVRFPSGKVLYHRPVPFAVALQLLKRLADKGHHTNIYIDDQLLVKENGREAGLYKSISGVDPVVVGDLAAHLQEVRREPTKVLVVASEEKINGLHREMKEIFGESLYITKSKPYFLEFMHPAATKGRALQAVAHHYGIGPESIIAVGDSYNDLDMLEYAGLGAVMDNAGEDIKKRADFVTGSNNDGGVAGVINKFIVSREDIL